jgi:type I restriction enzyme R subunit
VSERRFTESVVEDAVLAWLESLGYAVKHGPDIAPGGETLTLTQWERELLAGGFSRTFATVSR